MPLALVTWDTLAGLARDLGMPLTDVQWVLGHAHLSTTLVEPAGRGEGDSV